MSPTFTDPLQAASEAIFGVLSVAAFLAVAPGGAVDTIPQNPTYPFLLYSVSADRQFGGFGTKPGTGTLPEVGVTLHGYSLVTMAEAQAAVSTAIDLLKDAPTVTGYGSWAIFWDDLVPLPNEMLIGITVQEVVARGRLYIEEGAG